MNDLLTYCICEDIWDKHISSRGLSNWIKELSSTTVECDNYKINLLDWLVEHLDEYDEHMMRYKK